MRIDAVITWVDGEDPVHKARRRLYRRPGFQDQPFERNAITPHRFRDHGELRYCVRSIRNYAPWIRYIHIVTDDQTPRYFNSLLARRSGVRFVSHRQIFAGLELIRPVFNSRAIETLIWRVPELTEHFIYFNDDTFLCAPVQPADFFAADRKAIVRGRLKAGRSKINTGRMHGSSKFARAADLADYPNDQYVFSAHVPRAMLRSVLENAFQKMQPLFIQNASYRFRDARQFSPVALHDHLAIKEGHAVLQYRRDTLFISGRNSKTLPEGELKRRFSRLFDGDVKCACLNNMPVVIERLNVGEDELRQLFGKPLPFEQEDRGRLESFALRLKRGQQAIADLRALIADRNRFRSAETSPGGNGLSEKELKRRDAKTRKRARSGVFEELLDDICARLSREGGGFFLQVGANDGMINDPLSRVVKRYGIRGLCVEPLPTAFERLKTCYANFEGVRLANVAIGPNEGAATMYLPKLPGMRRATGRRAAAAMASAERKASFLPEVARRIAARKNRVSQDAADDYIWKVPVNVVTLPRLLEEQSVERIDILQVDTEGFDYEVLKQFDFERYSPVIVNFEHQHLTSDDMSRCTEMLSEHGYLLFRHGRDTCAIRAFSDVAARYAASAASASSTARKR